MSCLFRFLIATAYCYALMGYDYLVMAISGENADRSLPLCQRCYQGFHRINCPEYAALMDEDLEPEHIEELTK